MRRVRLRASLWFAIVIALAVVASCAGPPPPTDAAKRLAANARATVEGRVVDEGGRAVAGVQVQGIPGGRDIIWEPAATTDADGRFRLALDAPAEYVFLISEGGQAVVTASPLDPSEVRITVRPGETRTGVELTYLRGARAPLLHPLEPTPASLPSSGSFAIARDDRDLRLSGSPAGSETSSSP